MISVHSALEYTPLASSLALHALKQAGLQPQILEPLAVMTSRTMYKRL